MERHAGEDHRGAAISVERHVPGVTAVPIREGEANRAHPLGRVVGVGVGVGDVPEHLGDRRGVGDRWVIAVDGQRQLSIIRVIRGRAELSAVVKHDIIEQRDAAAI